MEKRLTAKIQKINPKLPDQSNMVSGGLLIKPDDELALERKGTLYTVFDIQGKNNLDSLLVTKIVNDVLHDSYYRDESASPIQSIEKTILKLRDNVTQISTSVGGEDINLVFNIATAVLWGNTLYLVQYGSTNIYIMRDGNIKPVEASSEGKFSVASGVVKDNDVVILASSKFAQKYPPQSLISTSGLSMENLDVLESALILKFDIIREFSESEVIEFSYAVDSPPDTKSKVVQEPVETNLKPATSTLTDENANHPEKNRFKESTEHTQENYYEIPKQPTQKIERAHLGSRLDSKKKPKWLLVAGIALGIFAVFAIGNAIFGGSEEKQPQVENEQTERQTGSSDEDFPVINAEEDAANKVRRVDSSVFYDIKIADETAEASEIVVIGNSIYISDANAGRLFVSEISTPKFTLMEGISDTDINSIENLTTQEGNLAFTSNQGSLFTSFNLSGNEISQQFEGSFFTPTATYLEFIYTVDGNQLTKYTPNQGDLDESLWTQNSILTNAVEMGIDVSIYVLTSEGQIYKFTTGTLDEFEITGLSTPISNPSDMVLDVDLNNIYIADNGDSRIVVLSKDGNLLRQYKLSNESEWSDIRGVGVNETETIMFVLNGNRVYEVPLISEE
jgi:serine/threonine protein phosphatase PrpC